MALTKFRIMTLEKPSLRTCNSKIRVLRIALKMMFKLAKFAARYLLFEQTKQTEFLLQQK